MLFSAFHSCTDHFKGVLRSWTCYASSMARPDPSENRTDLERLQRVMADAGVAARRVCERLIIDGHVQVNGKTVTQLPIFVNPHTDDIKVDGRRLPKPERLMYLMLNKPEQTLTSASDEPGMDRRTVLDLVRHPAAARLFPVGRLDFDTTGLVILTNDGELTHRLTHPRFCVIKTYHALVRGTVSDEHLEAIQRRLRSEMRREERESATVSARRAAFGRGRQELRIVKSESGRTVLEISLTEARNRQIREVLAMLGCPVKKLTRVALGPLLMTGLAPGHWRELTRDEVRLLKEAGSNRSNARKAPVEPPKAKGRSKAGRKPGTKPESKPQVDSQTPESAAKLQPPALSKAAPALGVAGVKAKPKSPRVLKF